MAQLKRKLDIETSPGVSTNPSFTQTHHFSNGKRLNSQVPIYAKHLVQPYRRIKKIGQGKHSICYEIIHPNGNTYAMKTLPIHDHNFKNNHMSRIMNEIEIQKNLSKHKNIATFIEEFQVENEYVAIIMDYYPNNSLETHFNNGTQLREWELRKLMTQLIGGLYWIHKNDIVHGDLKLGNLLLDERFNLRICDFGHSFNNCHNEVDTRNFINSTTFISNSSNKIIGTPNYIAPEIIERIIRRNTTENVISFEIDIWSVGVILYALICGEFPFLDETLDKMCEKILTCVVEFPQTRKNNGEISYHVHDLISKLLRKHPLERLTIPEIINHAWFQSYFPESFNIYDNFSIDSYENSSMNLQSTLNFKKCLMDSGLSKLMKPMRNDEKDEEEEEEDNEFKINDNNSNDNDNRNSNIISNIFTSPRKSNDNLLSESFINNNNNESVDFRKIRQFLIHLEEHSTVANKERMEKIRKYQPPSAIYSNPINFETSKSILFNQYQSTLIKILDYEQIYQSSGKLCPSNNGNDDSNNRSSIYCMNKMIIPDTNAFVYKLFNGDVGTLFANGHTLLKVSDSDSIWYIIPDEECGWISKCFDINNEILPNELQDKINEASAAANMLNVGSGMMLNGLLGNEPRSEDVFVRNITIYENNEITMMQLSNGIIQFDFQEDEFTTPMILLIKDLGETITVVSDFEGIRTMKMLDFIQRYDCDKSSSRFRDKLMIVKKCLKERLNL